MVTEINPESGGTTPQGAQASEDLTQSADKLTEHPSQIPEERRLEYQPRRRRSFDDNVGDALGWLSIGLGIAGLAAPRLIGRAIGMPEHSGLLRAVGARELASGAGLLTQRERAPWLWSRVIGDAMDLALIGTALRPSNPRRARAAGALAVVGVVTAVDVAASMRHTRMSRGREGREAMAARQEPLIEQALIVNKSPQECYAYWRDFANLPRFMRSVQSIVIKDDRTTHWVVQGPGRARVEWDSQVTVDRPGERVSWRSLEGSAVTHAGTVRFEPAPGGRGCIVRVLMHYRPPLGKAGVAVAKLLGRDPKFETREDLRRFKQLIETGEIPTTVGQPSGRRSWFGRLTPEGRKSRAGKILEEGAL